MSGSDPHDPRFKMAWWCNQHDRWECEGNRTNGEKCHACTSAGQKRCKNHSGKSRTQVAAESEAITAWNSMGGDPTVDYRMAVLSVLQMTCLRLHLYSSLLKRQYEVDAGSEEQGPEDGLSGDTSGIIGHKYAAAGKDGRIFAASEEIRGLVQLEASERDRVVRYSKTAHDMGIEERMTSLAERWGDQMSVIVNQILDDMDLTPEQERRVPEVVMARLQAVPDPVELAS